MSCPTAIAIACGKQHPENLYIKLKTGVVYRFRDSLSTTEQAEIAAGLQRNRGRIPGLTAKYSPWIKVR